MNKIKYIFHFKQLLIVLLRKKLFCFIPDNIFLKMMYRLILNEKCNIKNPKTFNEKLQWLKLYDRKDIYTTMVDKYEVKKYVSSVIGEKYIIPTLGIYNKFEDIDFDNLPSKFVIKCTHDSGGLVIVKDKLKLNIEAAKKIINKSLKRNYYYSGREWPYKNVKPRIIVEKYMEDENDSSMHDYKIHCFNGKAKYILVCTDREEELKETFFDIEWNISPFKRPNHEIDKNIKKPSGLSSMIQLAEKLSKNIPFLRVDFYQINGKIYFGELTFFPAAGFAKFEPEEWDEKLGELIDLSVVKRNEK